MTNEVSPWEKPAATHQKSPQELLEDRYPEGSEDIDDMVMIVDGSAELEKEVVRFGVGDRVAVERSNKKVEYDWHVSGVEQRPDPTTGETVEYRIVKKTVGDIEMTKTVKLEVLESVSEALEAKTKLDLGREAIEGVGVHSPDQGPIDIGHFEAVPVKPESVESAPERPLTKQELYEAKKQEIALLIEQNELSDIDAFYLEQYAEAGDGRYDAQSVALSKMTDAVRGNTALIHEYQRLHNAKKALMS